MARFHKGKGEVPKFFEASGATVEVTEFTQLAFASNDTDVMVVSTFGLRVPATGKQGAMDLHHWFRFNDQGKVSLPRNRGHGSDRRAPDALTSPCVHVVGLAVAQLRSRPRLWPPPPSPCSPGVRDDAVWWELVARKVMGGVRVTPRSMVELRRLWTTSTFEPSVF